MEYDEQAKNLSVIGMQRDEPPIPKVEEPVINEPQEELEEYIDLDNPVFDDETDAPKNTGSKAAMFVGGMKDKFAQAQYNSQVMSIEKKNSRSKKIWNLLILMTHLRNAHMTLVERFDTGGVTNWRFVWL